MEPSNAVLPNRYRFSWKDLAIGGDLVIAVVLNRYSSVLPFGIVIALVIGALAFTSVWAWQAVARSKFSVYLKQYPIVYTAVLLILSLTIIECIRGLEGKLPRFDNSSTNGSSVVGTQVTQSDKRATAPAAVQSPDVTLSARKIPKVAKQRQYESPQRDVPQQDVPQSSDQFEQSTLPKNWATMTQAQRNSAINAVCPPGTAICAIGSDMQISDSTSVDSTYGVITKGEHFDVRNPLYIAGKPEDYASSATKTEEFLFAMNRYLGEKWNS